MRLLLLPVLVSAVLLTEAVASASVTDISVKSVKNLGTFAGKPYREAEIQVSGAASGGAYSVTAVLAYPSRRSDANGFALVDPYNTVLFSIPGWPGEPFLVPEARRFLGDEYTFGRGNVYIAVLWDKTVVEARNEGFIAAAIDAYDVLRDVSTLVRSPKSMPYPRRFRRPPVLEGVRILRGPVEHDCLDHGASFRRVWIDPTRSALDDVPQIRTALTRSAAIHTGLTARVDLGARINRRRQLTVASRDERASLRVLFRVEAMR